MRLGLEQPADKLGDTFPRLYPSPQTSPKPGQNRLQILVRSILGSLGREGDVSSVIQHLYY